MNFQKGVAMNLSSTDINNTNNLFLLWEQELMLRHDLRKGTRSVQEVKIETAADLDLLYRALYFSDYTDFFTILINNLSNTAALNWLQNAPDWLVLRFWSFLPWYLQRHVVSTDNLQFLIRLYKSDLKPEYQRILKHLNLSQVQYLISRTANPALRELFKQQETILIDKRQQAYYGLADKSRLPYPTIYGDKSVIIVQTLDLLSASEKVNFSDPYGSERFIQQLLVAEGLFQCGLIYENIAYLKKVYREYEQENRLVALLDEQRIVKNMSQQLRRLLPLHALLTRQVQPKQYVLLIYEQYFPRLLPDEASLLYLDLYLKLLDYLSRDNSVFPYDVQSVLQQLEQKHPGDKELFSIMADNISTDKEDLQPIILAIKNRLTSMPHEAFVLLEFLRILLIKGYLVQDIEIFNQVLTAYAQLWRWVPSFLFFNPAVTEQIGWANSSLRQHFEKISGLLDYYHGETLFYDLKNRPDLFRKKDETARREILFGKLTGVLI